MLTRHIAYYEARIVFGMASLLPLLLLPGYMFLGWILWTSRQTRPPLPEITYVFELVLTLSGGLSCAHLMTIEREVGFNEIRRTYAEPSWRVPFMRAIEALLFVCISGLVAAALLRFAYGDYDLSQVFVPALPPALFLCALALLMNNVTGSYWITAGTVIAYWYVELTSAGLYTGPLFLFQHSMPNADLDTSLNRGLLVVGGLIFFTLNALFSTWSRRHRVGR